MYLFLNPTWNCFSIGIHATAFQGRYMTLWHAYTGIYLGINYQKQYPDYLSRDASKVIVNSELNSKFIRDCL